jgi:protein gp37
VIAGGESGPNARPTHPDWCRSLRDHCKASGIPFHFKQWGEWLPMSQFPTGTNDLRGVEITGPPHAFWARVGKKAAGRLLDGEAHDGVPAGSKRVVSINGHLFHLGEF